MGMPSGWPHWRGNTTREGTLLETPRWGSKKNLPGETHDSKEMQKAKVTKFITRLRTTAG